MRLEHYLSSLKIVFLPLEEPILLKKKLFYLKLLNKEILSVHSFFTFYLLDFLKYSTFTVINKTQI